MKRFLIILFLTFSLVAQAALPSSNILIFVSFSMPKASLVAWLQDANKIGAPVIIRGLVNNSFKETTRTIYSFTKETGNGVQIDPLLFQQFDIQKVPALLLTNCSDLKFCTDDYIVVYGDIPVEYTLRQISQKNNAYSKIAERALTQLKEASHV